MITLEKQAALGRELFDLNASTLRRLVALQADGVHNYFEINRTYAEKLPEIKDVSSFMELQREYGEVVWKGFAEGLKANGEVLREAAESAGEALRGAFAADEPQAPKADENTSEPAPTNTAA